MTVPVYVAALVGAMTSLCCFFASRYKHLISIDEGLDIFALHGVGGFVGDILTGFFAASWVPALDGASGTTYEGGWWDHNWKQMGYQLAAATVCAAWSFVITCILLFVINRIPGCHIRADEEDELNGLDIKYFTDVESEMFGLGELMGGVGGSGGSSMRAASRMVTMTGEAVTLDGEKAVRKSD